MEKKTLCGEPSVPGCGPSLQSQWKISHRENTVPGSFALLVISAVILL
jgi:hypothetical protein